VRLPAGHPFVLPPASFWTEETFFEQAFGGVTLTRIVSLRQGVTHIMLNGENAFVLCVRGRR
jgi:hypothetical protein